MPLEIERKYLVTSDKYKVGAKPSEITQAYLTIQDNLAIRVRIDFTSIPHRFHFGSLRSHFDLTSISLRVHIGSTSISLRPHFDLRLR